MTEPLISVATPDDLADRATRERYLAILSTDEKQRLARLLSKAHQELFLLAHGPLRTQLRLPREEQRDAKDDRRRWTFRSWRAGASHQAALALSVD
jgi:hypothetical protein